MDEKNGLADTKEDRRKLVSTTIREVCEALKERGYNPINQLVGYLISGDPGYISGYKESRLKILEFDRSEIVTILLEDYIHNSK